MSFSLLRIGILFFFSAFFFTSSALAQKKEVDHEDILHPKPLPPSHLRLVIGVEGGINYNSFSETINAPADYSYQVLGQGSKIAPYGKVFLDYGFTENFGLVLKAFYDDKSFGNKGGGNLPCTIHDQTTGDTTTIMSAVNLEYSVSLPYFGATVAARYSILPEWFLSLGPTFQFGPDSAKGTATFMSTDTTGGSGGCFFNYGSAEQSKTLTVRYARKSFSTRIGAELASGYKIGLSPGIALVPTVSFQYFFTNILDRDANPDGSQNASGGNLFSIQGGIGLLFTL